MTTRTQLIIASVIFTLIVCATTPLLNIIFAFLVMGLIPGTHYAIPYWMMLLGYPMAAMAIVIWASSRTLFIGETVKPAKKAPVKAKTTRTKKKTTTKSPAKRRARAAA